MFNKYNTDEDYINAREKYIQENFFDLLESFAIKQGTSVYEAGQFSVDLVYPEAWENFIEQKWIEYNDDLETKDLNTLDYTKTERKEEWQ